MRITFETSPDEETNAKTSSTWYVASVYFLTTSASVSWMFIGLVLQLVSSVALPAIGGVGALLAAALFIVDVIHKFRPMTEDQGKLWAMYSLSQAGPEAAKHFSKELDAASESEDGATTLVTAAGYLAFEMLVCRLVWVCLGAGVVYVFQTWY